MKPSQYVGVSGVTIPGQARALLAAWPTDAPAQSLMIGVLTSQKVLAGGERNARSPAAGDIAELFQTARQAGLRPRAPWESLVVPRTLNMIHYFTKDTTDLGEQLLRACAHGGETCDGVQVNVPWPDPEQLLHFLNCGGWERVALQIGPRAMVHDSTAEDLTRTLRAYEGIITDVLLDMSAGRGLPIDAERARGWSAAIREAFPDLGIGIAGGLCAETLVMSYCEECQWRREGVCPGHGAIPDLIRSHGLSIDAEGRLRNDRDELDLDKARAYLAAAAPLVCGGGR